jgi:hypothetical protein
MSPGRIRPARDGRPGSDDLPAHEEPAAAADEPEPEDVPRRARPDEDSRLSDDEDVPGDDWPVFQKSATPYWTGAVTHAED